MKYILLKLIRLALPSETIKIQFIVKKSIKIYKGLCIIWTFDIIKCMANPHRSQGSW